MISLSALVLACTQIPSKCIQGDGVVVSGFAALAKATSEQISFFSNERYSHDLIATSAAAIVLSSLHYEKYRDILTGKALIVSDNPYAFFAYAAQYFESSQTPKSIANIHPTAIIDPSASIASGVSIGAFTHIMAGASIDAGVSIASHCSVGENSSIGQNSRIYPSVTIYHGVTLGSSCIVHSGTVIGSDGFGFAPHHKKWVKIPQTGGVFIGDDVEIGSNCSIDRGALGDTIIGRGTKLDNLIQIAHNVHIGEDCAFAANLAIAGSAILGNRIQIGGNAGVLGHLSVCDDVVISSSTLVTKTINKPGFYSGVYPIQENAEWEKNAVVLKRLAGLREQVKELEKKLKDQP